MASYHGTVVNEQIGSHNNGRGTYQELNYIERHLLSGVFHFLNLAGIGGERFFAGNDVFYHKDGKYRYHYNALPKI